MINSDALTNDTRIKVYNRDNGTVGYRIEDMNNLRRVFQPGETKEITFDELKRLSYQTGGTAILRDLLIVYNEDAVRELIGDVEPEYYYTAAEIKKLLTEGTLDQLQDCLDFAPEGALELIKDIAVGTKLNDMRKRDMIQKKLNFNVTNAISINEQSAEDEGEVEAVSTRQRRAAPINGTVEAATPMRKTTPPSYKVVSK